MITYRPAGQQRMDFGDAPQKRIKPVETVIYQKSSADVPWAVGVIRDRYDRWEVTIYHGELRDGKTRFCELRFDNAVDVVKFASSMLNAWTSLGKRITYTGEDTSHLYAQLVEVME